MKFKNPTVILIVGLLLGVCGLDRFMMGSFILGLVKLFTFGLFGILWLLDLFILPGKAREENMKTIQPYL